MTSLTPLISANYNANLAALALNHSFLPVQNSERPLFAQATFDVSSPPLIGQTGATFIDDTAVYSNARGWFAIQILDTAVFDSLVSNWDAPPTGFAFTKDHVIYGKFTSIQLASGAVLAYKL
jgi:hypothetical protein